MNQPFASVMVQPMQHAAVADQRLIETLVVEGYEQPAASRYLPESTAHGRWSAKSNAIDAMKLG